MKGPKSVTENPVKRKTLHYYTGLLNNIWLATYLFLLLSYFQVLKLISPYLDVSMLTPTWSQ